MKIRSHKDLDVYKLAFELAMNIFQTSKQFPQEEKYSLTDQAMKIIKIGLFKFGRSV